MNYYFAAVQIDCRYSRYVFFPKLPIGGWIDFLTRGFKKEESRGIFKEVGLNLF